MTQAQFIQCGDAVDFTAGAAITGGDVVVQGALVGIAKGDVANGALGSLAVYGVFDVVKAGGAGVTFAVGATVYWDDSNNLAVATDGSGANKSLGKCVLAAADDDVKVRVRLVQ